MKRWLWMAVVAGLTVQPAWASHHRSNGQDHVGLGQTFTIPEGETAGDVACAFCTVRVEGDVSGDVLTFFGNVEVAPDRRVAGDLAVFGGSTTLKDGARVGGDLFVFGSDFSQADSTTIGGDHWVFAGGGWLLAFLMPLLIPIGFIWLVIHLVRRNRYVFPAYPGGRRY
jgi:hypothetical protein